MFESVCAEESVCLKLWWIFARYACLYILLYICICAGEKEGVGGYSWAELLHWDVSFYLPLSSRTGTATCPNCKEDERIKELEFGCDCNEEISALTASIFGAFWITPHANTQEIMKNQTLVDWLVVSGGIHFEPDWESKNEMKIEESGKRMGIKKCKGRKPLWDNLALCIEHLLKLLIIDMTEKINIQHSVLISAYFCSEHICANRRDLYVLSH